MGRRPQKCLYCDINDKNWKSTAIPVNLGDFGDDYEIQIWVSRYSKKLGVDFGQEQHEPIISTYMNINFCPVCGARLPGCDET